MKKFFCFAPIVGLLALSGSAFAQSELKAKIPFAFATPAGGEMPAGNYVISQLVTNTGVSSYRILNMDTRKAVAALSSTTVKRPGGETDYRPMMTFRCIGDSCALSGIYRTGSALGDGMRAHPRKAVDPTTQIAEIAIPLGE